MGSKGVILVADDEESVREIGVKILSEAGFEAIGASCGEEALKIIGERKGGVTLVVMDLGMPGMGGARCIRRIREEYPAIKVVVSSGTAGAEEELEELAEGVEVLDKPYRLADLLACVRRLT